MRGMRLEWRVPRQGRDNWRGPPLGSGGGEYVLECFLYRIPQINIPSAELVSDEIGIGTTRAALAATGVV